MGEKPVAVVDANALLNLAMPVVDGRDGAPSGGDPLKTLLAAYDVYTPATVLGEVADASTDGDLLGVAAELAMKASDHLTTRDVAANVDGSLDYGLDPGESRGIWLANDVGADLFVTDGFNTSNYLLVAMELEDRNTLYTSPHVLCELAEREILAVEYANAVLAYLCERKHWDDSYVAQLRGKFLSQ